MSRPLAGPCRFGAVGLLAVPLLLSACSETPLSPTDPETAPGAGIETREARLPVTLLPQWRDTTFTGFALPGEAGFWLVASEEGIRARTLLRFGQIPDSVTLFADTLFVPVDSFANASLFLRMDTTRSVFPPPPFTLKLQALERPFDAATASWTRAADGIPWTVPGGDLGRELASVTVEELMDTLSFTFPAVEDSLLTAWGRSGGEPGVAITVAESGARIRIVSILLGYDAFGRDLEVPFPFSQAPSPGVFIYEPEQPPPGARLRVGGLPAWRSYIAFQLPERIDGQEVRDIAVNHAELVFHPLDPPPALFLPTSSLVGQGVRLLGDPFTLGPKTPIGGAGQTLLTLDPDSLAAGRPIRLDITAPVTERITTGQAATPIRIGIRGIPDAQQLGFWDFGSAEHALPGRRPELVIVFSPPPRFGVP